METLNNEPQFPLNKLQTKGIKSVIEKNLECGIDFLIERVKEYCSPISYVNNVIFKEEEGKPYLVVQTFDTVYFMKLYKNEKAVPMELAI